MNRPFRPLAVAILVATLLSACGGGPHVRPGQPVGPPADFAGDAVRTRVILVGDAGDLGGSRRIMPEVLARMDDRTYTVFLGDNIYDFAEREAILAVQLEATSRGRGALFIAGNHDWDDGFGGLAWQAGTVRAAGGDFLPEPGCPGPALKQLPGMRIVALDSEWWLQDPETRPETPCADGNAALAALAEELARAGDPVLLVAHHPLESWGKHGGRFPWYRHLTPPIFGSIYVWMRQAGRWPQDVNADVYSAWIDGMRSALAEHPPLLAAHGHEHSLQMLAGGPIADAAGIEAAPAWPAIVSGSGAKETWVGSGDRTLFSSPRLGFAVVTVLESGATGIEVFHLGEEGACERGWAGWLVAPDEAAVAGGGTAQ